MGDFLYRKPELAFLFFFVLVKCYRKKNKKFKTDVITSSILLLAQPGLGTQNGYDQPRSRFIVTFGSKLLKRGD